MVAEVRRRKLVARGCELASMLPIWCPSLQGLRSRMRRRRETVERRDSESAWKVSMVTFVSLCLIAYVILLLVTLHSACRPAVYSVLVTPLLTLLLVCSFLLFTHSVIWTFHFLPTSSFSNTLPCQISLLLPLSNFKSTPSLLSSNHLLLYFSSIQSWLPITLHGYQDKLNVKQHTEGQKETSDWWMCLRQMKDCSLGL